MAEENAMSRNDRMRELGRWEISSEIGYSKKKRKNLFSGQTKEQRAEAKKLARRARSFAIAQEESGANQLADQALRSFVKEYNNRIALHGMVEGDMPSSFHILEAFVEYIPHLLNFRILPERDYQIDASDFLEFASGTECPADQLAAAYELIDGEIYNVTSTTDPHDALLASDTDTVGFLAASVIRRGDEAVVMLVCGSKEKPEDVDWTQSAVPDPKPWVEGLVRRAQDEEGFKKWYMIWGDLYKTFVLARYDLSRQTLLERAIGWESDVHWQWVTDIPAFSDLPDEKKRRMAQRLDTYKTTWRLSESVLLIPNYLNKRYEITATKKVRTELGRNATIQNQTKHAPPKSRVQFRMLRSLVVKRYTGSVGAVGRTYTSPRFQVEVEGFWRRLSNPESMGSDAAGNPIRGRTWVKAHLRYRENPPASDARIVFIKQTLRSAKAQAHGLKQKPLADTVPLPSVGKEEGISHIYVLTNPALKSDLWKIGYTDSDPEDRARQLSSTTGVPVSYLVVESWTVTDGVLAESAAHAALEDYRVTMRREFFQCQYAVLRNALVRAIEPWVITQERT
jgi:hypothetical protein